MQRIFQNLQTLIPVVVGTTEATVSAITDNTHEHNSRKQPKTREALTMTTLNNENNTTSLEIEQMPNAESIADNYNSGKQLRVAQPHDAWNTLNKTRIE